MESFVRLSITLVILRHLLKYRHIGCWNNYVNWTTAVTQWRIQDFGKKNMLHGRCSPPSVYSPPFHDVKLRPFSECRKAVSSRFFPFKSGSTVLFLDFLKILDSRKRFLERWFIYMMESSGSGQVQMGDYATVQWSSSRSGTLTTETRCAARKHWC